MLLRGPGRLLSHPRGFLLSSRVSPRSLSSSSAPFPPSSSLGANKSAYDIIEDQSGLDPPSGPMSGVKTRKLQIQNGLTAYLISDPETPMSAASVSVETGSWNDHRDHQGTAHFLEHMLFLGTAKYPDAGEYSGFISQNGGATNAYTSSDHTVYGFSANNSAFEGALDRFAQFFIAPLFNESCVNREMNAVDQEFRKNLLDDAWREYHVLKEVANQDHPFAFFNTGHLESMKRLNLGTLREWYARYYRAGAMRLVLYARHPLEHLQDLVAEKFAPLTPGTVPLFEAASPVFPESALGKIYYVSPIKEKRKMSLLWEIPDEFNRLDSKIADTLSHVVGHEGKGSLFSQLKSEGLVLSLSAGPSNLGGKNSTFEISVGLTKKGLAQRDLIVQRIFEALSMLASNPFPGYITEELNFLRQVTYKYQTRRDAFGVAMHHAAGLRKQPFQLYPRWGVHTDHFDPKLIGKLLRELTPLKCQIYVVAKPEEANFVPDKQERWMGVEYTVRPFSSEQLEQWTKVTPNPAVRFPERNPFTPDSLMLIEGREKHQPLVLRNDEFGKLVYKKDDTFYAPKATWRFHVRTPAIRPNDAKSLVLADLYSSCLHKHLNELSYPASFAGLDFSVSTSSTGVHISLDGYSQKAKVLLEQMLTIIDKFSPTPEDYDVFYESLLRGYTNTSLAKPVSQAFNLMKAALIEDYVTDKEKLETLHAINFRDLTDFSEKIVASRVIDGLCAGNITQQDATEAWNLVNTLLPGAPCSRELVKKPRVRDLDFSTPIFIDKKIDVAGNGVVLLVQVGDSTPKSRAYSDLISTAIDEPFYSQLRTEQQTGYIVSSSDSEIEKNLFIHFAVQSSTHDPRDLLARFELFLEGFVRQTKLDTFREKFEVIKAGRLEKIRAPFKNMGEETGHLEYVSFERDFDFQWRKKRIEALEQVTFEEFVQEVNRIFGRKNNKRLALLAEGVVSSSAEDNPYFSYSGVRSVAELKQKIKSKM